MRSSFAHNRVGLINSVGVRAALLGDEPDEETKLNGQVPAKWDVTSYAKAPPIYSGEGDMSCAWSPKQARKKIGRLGDSFRAQYYNTLGRRSQTIKWLSWYKSVGATKDKAIPSEVWA